MTTNVLNRTDSRPAIAARLKRLRKALGLTQTKMAEVLKVESQQAWANYENDKRPLPYEVALAIAQEWAIPMDWTYRGLTPMLPSMYREALGDEASASQTKESA